MTDYALGDTIYIMFTTRAFATGIPTTLSGSPVLSVYENNNAVQITSGVSVAADSDSVTGLNLATIVATGGNGYEVDKDYSLVITTGTVDSVSVVGEVVGHFTINRSAMKADAIQTTSFATGAIDSAAIAANAIGSSELAADCLTSSQFAANSISAGALAANTIGASEIADNAIDAAAFATGAITSTTIAANAIGASELATDAVTEIVDAVWAATTRILTAGTNLNDPTAAAVADAVWDEDIVAAHATADTAGLIISQLTSRAVTFNTAVDDTSILGQMVDDGTASFDRTTDSLQAVRDRGDAAWTTGAGGSDRLLMVDTTITGLSSQTVFNLSAGAAHNDAYNNCTVVIEDVSTATQKSIGVVQDYVGSTKTVTLKEAPSFTIANTDKIYILAENALKSTVKDRWLDVDATGRGNASVSEMLANVTVGTMAANVIDAASIATGAIDADALAANTITSAKIAASAIGATQIGAAAITSAKFAASAIDANAIAGSAITSAKFASGAIDATAIAANAIGSSELAAGAITAATFGAGAIDAAAIATGAIDGDAVAESAGQKIRAAINGTADSGSTTTMVDNARTEAATDYWKGHMIRFTSGSIINQTRIITGFTPGSDTITFSPPTTAAVGTNTYEITATTDPWTRVLGNTTYSASAVSQINAGILAGKISGLATTTATIRDIEDAANVMVATVDADGNRSATTIIAPAD